MEVTAIQKLLISIIPILFAITLHEVAHGWVAYLFGDKTAKLAGRLSLNPIRHIDLMGTIVVPILLLLLGNFIFGWAKPVPVDARNMRNPRYNMVLVAIAGPLANLVMAVIWAAVAKSALFLPPWFAKPLFLMGQAGMIINVVLAILNCLPIPPLDGGRALCNLLPGRLGWGLYKLEPYGFFILILLMVSGLLLVVMRPPIFFLLNGLNDLFGLNM